VDTTSYHLSAEVPIKSVHYLEWLGLAAKAGGGTRQSKAAIVRALVNVAMRLEIDVAGVVTPAELEQRIWLAIERRTRTAGILPERTVTTVPAATPSTTGEDTVR
jgi:hypothetical protein